MRTHLYTTFVDLRNVFDTMNRKGPRRIIKKFGGLEGFMHILRQLNAAIMTRVTDNGVVSEAFGINNEVKQVCVLAPNLFILMLMDAYRDDKPGLRINYRTDGQLLSIRRMQALTRLLTTTIPHLLLSDDCAFNNTTEVGMQRSMDLFASGCVHLGPTMNTNKTGITHQQPSTAEYSIPCIRVNGSELKLQQPEQQNFSLYQNQGRSGLPDLQSQPRLRPSTELRVDSSQPPTEHQTEDVQGRRPDDGAVTRIVDASYVKKLNKLHLRWQDRIPNMEVLDRTGILGIHALLRQLQKVG
nr:unnamed protein product [Spirometra erinaceieuropaei]